MIAGEAADAAALGAPGTGEAAQDRATRLAVRARRPSGAALLALVLGLAITAGLAVTAAVLYHHNERRLLKLRVRELSLVLSGATQGVQTPLASAAALADATGGNAARFRTLMAPYAGPGRQFASVSMWPLGAGALRPRVTLGTPLARAATRASHVSALARRPGALDMVGLLNESPPALGFGYALGGGAGSYAVFAESPLPADRRSSLEQNSAFSDLDYAVYLGRGQHASQLLLTSVRHPPLKGLTASDTVPFASSSLTIAITPRGSLGGGFFHSLPWLIVIGGVLISIAASMLTERLAQGRMRAEKLAAQLDKLAAENRERYIEQRSIAQTLQQALLPSQLPRLPGLQVNARYVPAQAGGDVGGDWYDIVAIDERHVLLVIGDVSGHGVEAATTMALVRHAALAYIAEDHRPAAVLAKLADFVGGGEHDYFATVLCALIDVQGRTLTLSSAGHLAPLLLADGSGEYVSVKAEPPIGFPHSAPFREATITVPPGATLVAFTDGLVERRGEVLDEGLERLREMAISEHLGGDDLLAKLARDLTSDDHRDDTALVSIQWQT
ncbi:MAG TPA: PP2C family protein-serine/threonine phosphatase [Solirubrobacteraceae bacterium]|jgi:serine phosphatase RsbU (regulator of sigma subunit)|nr:PP2C family protein-serine/threonine phosphatase [Solirubrobacteraceae bacterium]